ncbi:D-2-hydroxyacid dehydrogenase [Hungatella sp.]|uniref:D-2-hydroxyacid dehydrogenase n=1 Tax=Hungatella sp. TaxID=2613924 RepID=UPI00258E3A94|nr:D-2-hydroxyacid dehydrogenase [Hungatella sp.]MCI6451496.1 D-2-hydroxyacid dehydrogenase [Hungatella sp.]
MKIVILDGYTENPGDLSWEDLAALGELEVYDRTPAGEIEERMSGAEAVFTNKTPISRHAIENCPSLKYIGVLATGFDVVDIRAAAEAGITVTNVPSYGTDAVAQYTIALLLELCHHVGAHSDSVKAGEWTKSADWCFWNYPLTELSGKTMGIIGFGRIGQKTARIAEALGMEIKVFDAVCRKELETEHCRYADLEELLAVSDVICLHCPLNSGTKGIINCDTIAKMKDGVLIINDSRGPLIVEKDLKEALESGKVAGAAVDVVSEEPVREDNPLMTAPNMIITPHIAWASRESRKRLMDIAVDNLKSFLQGRPENVVSVLRQETV